MLLISLSRALLTTKPTQFRMNDRDHIGVVQYYTQLKVNGILHNIAIILPYGPPDPFLFEKSQGTCYSCLFLEGEEPVAIDAKKILSVVGMVPHKPVIPNQPLQTRFYLAEQMMLDVLDNARVEGNI
jgi:hypothetical protein